MNFHTEPKQNEAKARVSLPKMPDHWKLPDRNKPKTLKPKQSHGGDSFRRIALYGQLSPSQIQAGTQLQKVLERSQRYSGIRELLKLLRRCFEDACPDQKAGWDALIAILSENKTIQELGGRKRSVEKNISNSLKGLLSFLADDGADLLEQCLAYERAYGLHGRVFSKLA